MKYIHRDYKDWPGSGMVTCCLIAAVFLLVANTHAVAANFCKGKHYDPDLCEDDAGSAGNSGEQIDLDCVLVATSGDDNSDSIKGDNEPGVHPVVLGAYVDAEEKVRCGTGGTTQPNLSGLVLDSKKKGGPAHRKIDLALTGFEAWDGSSNHLPYLPDSIFEEGSNWDEMETVQLSVRPYRHARPANNYRDAEDQQGHIQLLEPDSTYSMAMRIRVKSVSDHPYIINLADTVVAGDKFQGIWCESTTPGWPNEEIVDNSKDVSVYLWPDDDNDGVADGYTVTTGQVFAGEAAYSLDNPPEVISASRPAAFCSPAGPMECEGAGVGEPCNFLGLAHVEFTWHAENR